MNASWKLADATEEFGLENDDLIRVLVENIRQIVAGAIDDQCRI
eukprot:COSAG02_NODE_30981_length_541_cov_1.233032_2_plen_43_part_01